MAILKSNCPICDVQVDIPADTEESEILTCSDCNMKLVVSKICKNKVILEEAPEVEEDWGQ